MFNVDFIVIDLYVDVFGSIILIKNAITKFDGEMTDLCLVTYARLLQSRRSLQTTPPSYSQPQAYIQICLYLINNWCIELSPAPHIFFSDIVCKKQ